MLIDIIKKRLNATVENEKQLKALDAIMHHVVSTCKKNLSAHQSGFHWRKRKIHRNLIDAEVRLNNIK